MSLATRTVIHMPVRDQLLRGNNMSIVVGPLKDLNRDLFTEALITLGQRGPAARIGYVYQDDTTWVYDPANLKEVCAEMVQSFEPSTPERAAQLAAEIAQDDSKYPVRFYISDGYMIEVYHHALGDAQAAYGMIDAIFTILRGETTNWGMESGETFRPTISAFVANFANRPKNIIAAYKAKKYGQAPADESGDSQQVSKPGAIAYAVIDTDKTKALNLASRKEGATINAVMFDAIRQRFAENGINSASTHATYDLRRYLPENERTGGNFVAALPFSDTALTSPALISAEQENNMKAALPLLAASFGLTKATVVNALRRTRRGAVRFSPFARARLVFSGMGVVRAIERLPWDISDGQTPFYTAYVNPGDGNEISTNVIKVKNRMFITACFYPEAYSREDVQQALNTVAGDPTFYIRGADVKTEAAS